jgi:hypothetical protein
MTTIRPAPLPVTATPTGGRPVQPASTSFAQRLQGGQGPQAAAQQAAQTPGHSLDDGTRPLTGAELQEELKSVALQQGMMMGQRLLTMNNSGLKLDTE